MNDSKKLGWVRVYRQSMDSSVWKNPIVWFVWSWCLLKANHEDNNFPFNREDILIKRGSFISGILSAQKELPTLSTQNIRTAFTYLKSTGRITITSTNKFSIITIVKYNNFQDNNIQTNKPLTSHSQATNKPLTTNNNDKNDNNEKNISEQGSQEISSIIKMFEIINPSIGKMYGNKTQRFAVDRLLKKYGKDKVIGMINYLPIINSDKYAKGKSITPLQLEDNLGLIVAHYNQNKKEKSKFSVDVIS